jgi:protein TonB
MKALVEGTLFLGFATALHVALWQGLPDGSAEGAGEGGSASLSIAGADAVLAAMVADWERPPATPATRADAPTQPHTTMLPPVIPATPAAPSVALAPRPQPFPQVDATPTVPTPPPIPPIAETAPLAPPVTESPRPPARRAEASAQASPAPVVAPARRAEGAGAGPTRGSRAATETAGRGAAARQTALAEWGGQIRARIDRARPRAVGRGQSVLSLTVARDGRLVAASVVGSSGQAALDRAALRAVTGAGRFPAAPVSLTEAQYHFRLPVRFD